MVQNIRGGIRSGIRSGVNQLWGGLRAPQSAADMIAATGGFPAPESLWLGNQASDAADLIGGNDLTDFVSSVPTHEVENARLGTVTEYDNASLDAMQAAAVGTLNVGLGSALCLFAGEIITGNTGINIMGNRTLTAGNAGYEMRLVSGVPRMAADDGATISTASTPSSVIGSVVLLAGLIDRNTDDIRMMVDGDITEDSGLQACTTGDLTSDRQFSLGRTPLSSCVSMHLWFGAIWRGVDAEGFLPSNLASLKAWAGAW